MLPVGQEHRPEVRRFSSSRIEYSDRSGGAALGGNAHDRAAVASEQDGSFAIRGASNRGTADIANRLRGAAGNIDLLQRRSKLKKDVAAVMRPEERKVWIISGSRQGP